MIRTRKKVSIEKVEKAETLGQTSNEELLKESKNYDPENYDPMEDMDQKEIIVPDNNKTEVITMRFTKQENEILKLYARKKGISKSSVIRSILLEKINDLEEIDEKSLMIELNAKLDKLNSLLESHYEADKKTS